MPLQTIDEVIARLDEIIHEARRERSRLGYFTTLYRNVTVKVKEGIAAGLFENGERMGRFDVIFANRYLAAFESFKRGERPSKCWLVSFEAAADWPPIIVQHLLLGINAHINFDLGVAAAEVAPGDELPTLKHDFDLINGILASLMVKVKHDIEEVSPWIKMLDMVAPMTQDKFINFSLERARICAWNVAVKMNSLTPDERAGELTRLDWEVAVLARLLRRPAGFFVNAALLVIRLRESSDVPHVIDVLAQV
ncbi:MAG TPA: DUF5995 family protein [Pyrinomonadaceae bacterium]|nr:DUF5995 family protein [Pyrinomonadaceae bacterium]